MSGFVRVALSLPNMMDLLECSQVSRVLLLQGEDVATRTSFRLSTAASRDAPPSWLLFPSKGRPSKMFRLDCVSLEGRRDGGRRDVMVWSLDHGLSGKRRQATSEYFNPDIRTLSFHTRPGLSADGRMRGTLQLYSSSLLSLVPSYNKGTNKQT